METKINVVAGFIFMSVLFLWSYSFNSKTEKIWNKLEAEYPLIEKHEQFINCKITGIYKLDHNRFRIHTNSLMITLNDSIKRDLSVGDEIRTGKRLHEVLQIGDHLLKLPDSTSVELLRIRWTDTLDFHFNLHDKNLRPLK